MFFIIKSQVGIRTSNTVLLSNFKINVFGGVTPSFENSPTLDIVEFGKLPIVIVRLEEGLGIRIEDDIVITKEGHENLTRAIPKTVEEIEAFMAN